MNAARCPVYSNQRDGMGRVDGNYGAALHYEPNSFGQWQGQPEFMEPPLKINGDAAFWDAHADDASRSRQRECARVQLTRRQRPREAERDDRCNRHIRRAVGRRRRSEVRLHRRQRAGARTSRADTATVRIEYVDVAG